MEPEPAPETEKPDHPATDSEPAEEPSEAEAGPDLTKALVVFLLINGAFALLGGVAYLVYRMKKKKSAAGTADAEPAEEEEPEDEKRAA
jgi:hypothetical protein